MSDEQPTPPPIYQQVTAGSDSVTTLFAADNSLVITMHGVGSLPLGSMITVTVVLGSATLEETEVPPEVTPEPEKPPTRKHMGMRAP